MISLSEHQEDISAHSSLRRCFHSWGFQTFVLSSSKVSPQHFSQVKIWTLSHWITWFFPFAAMLVEICLSDRWPLHDLMVYSYDCLDDYEVYVRRQTEVCILFRKLSLCIHTLTCSHHCQLCLAVSVFSTLWWVLHILALSSTESLKKKMVSSILYEVLASGGRVCDPAVCFVLISYVTLE